ncbi:hypothetical protein K490DRAFT_52924 [Saccharata proteae CBS 121410]|uniref:Uncharacterized protein n=1 Tax=Saccharata proteae CBS 121410 TaxID=1314787 RepID=A0A9P4LYM1_9PEZI|nr:hypothetical protein K490DRAFT_52924 [Saccharata proteae CBS 121410]
MPIAIFYARFSSSIPAQKDLTQAILVSEVPDANVQMTGVQILQESAEQRQEKEVEAQGQTSFKALAELVKRKGGGYGGQCADILEGQNIQDDASEIRCDPHKDPSGYIHAFYQGPVTLLDYTNDRYLFCVLPDLRDSSATAGGDLQLWVKKTFLSAIPLTDSGRELRCLCQPSMRNFTRAGV